MLRLRPIMCFLALAAAVPAAPERTDPDVIEPALRQYLDNSGIRWKTKQTKHFRLYFENDSEAWRHSGALRRNVEGDRKRVLKLIGEEEYPETVYAFFVTSGVTMKKLVGVEVDGRSRPVQHAVFSVVNKDRLHLTHELCHEIASNLWGAAEHWIEEGLAVYADEGDNVYFDSWKLLESGNLIPLSRLVDPAWTTSMYSPDVTYTELGGFVKFLHNRYGVEKVKRVWQGGSRSIPEVFGKPLSELERDWRDALVGQFPERPTRHYRSGAAELGIQ